jgi:NAD(P)-dependent dehydrogenase (short-subunit alcohol dehydrogenase family)
LVVSKRLVIVTGASGGIGRAVAEALARYDLVGIDRTAPPQTWPGTFLQLDLRSQRATQVVAMSKAVLGRHIQAVVFAAGTYRRLSIDAYDPDELEALMWDNFKSVFFLTREILPRLVEQGGGRLIMITSGAAAAGGYDPAYAASKGALVSFMKSIAREYGAAGIRCNAVSPGPVATPMAEAMGAERREYYRRTIPIGRLCSSDDVASVVAFLASDAADAVSGATIDVDGGLLRR